MGVKKQFWKRSEEVGKAYFWAGLSEMVGRVSRNSSSSETPRATPVVTGVSLAVTTPSLRSPRPKGRDVASLSFLRGLFALDAPVVARGSLAELCNDIFCRLVLTGLMS